MSLPISDALKEASSDSVSDLFSRDIELITDADLDRIIAELRSNRARLEAAEAAGTKLPRAKKVQLPKGPVEPIDINDLQI